MAIRINGADVDGDTDQDRWHLTGALQHLCFVPLVKWSNIVEDAEVTRGLCNVVDNLLPWNSPEIMKEAQRVFQGANRRTATDDPNVDTSPATKENDFKWRREHAAIAKDLIAAEVAHDEVAIESVPDPGFIVASVRWESTYNDRKREPLSLLMRLVYQYRQATRAFVCLPGAAASEMPPRGMDL